MRDTFVRDTEGETDLTCVAAKIELPPPPAWLANAHNQTSILQMSWASYLQRHDGPRLASVSLNPFQHSLLRTSPYSKAHRHLPVVAFSRACPLRTGEACCGPHAHSSLFVPLSLPSDEPGRPKGRLRTDE